MTENELAQIVYSKGLQVHKELGPGLLESVYEECLEYELKQAGLKIDRQRKIPVYYKNVVMESGFRADLIVNDKLLLELKSVKNIESIHLAQTITYLKMADLKLGLLINFNVTLYKNGVHRVANGM